MKHADVDDRLEVITPEGLSEAPAVEPVARREPFRVTAKQVGLVAGLVVAGVLFAAYAALAVSGVRALERDRDRASQLTAEREALSRRLLASVVAHDDTAVVAQATRDLLLEHRDRVVELADHARRVRAVDPGVRSLRRAMVGAFMRDAHDLEHAAEAPAPAAAPMLGRGYPFADRLLDQARRQWRLGPGQVPESTEHLRSADIPLVRLATWSDVKTGARLLVSGDSGLRLLDLDSSVQTPVEFEGVGGIGDVAVGPGVIVVVAEGAVVLIDPDDLFARRLADLGQDFQPRQVVVSSEGGAWVQGASGPAVVEVDRQGRPTGASSPAHGRLMADVGPSLLWAAAGEEDNRRPPFRGDYVLTDEATGEVVASWNQRELLAASPQGMAWRVDSQSLEVMDGAGRLRPVPTRADLFPRSAAFAPDGRLAVGWGDGRLDVIDVGTAALTASVATGGPAVLGWTPSGQYVFFAMGTGLGWYRPGEDQAHNLRIRNAGGFLTAAF